MRSQIDTSVPNSARVWNYLMGGKDHYEPDRLAGEEYLKIAPQAATMARESREFLIRAVTYASRELGVRQFLDIGTGLPTYENTHEVAQRIAPDARIVYVDNDPLVLVHARALLYGTSEGVVDYVDADLREPEKILEAAGQILDFTKPVALLLMGVLGHIEDYKEAKATVHHLQTALCPGSYFVHYDGIDSSTRLKEAQQGYDNTGATPYVLRSPTQIAAYYEGLEILEPGIVSCPLWRPEFGASPEPTDVYGGIARKP